MESMPTERSRVGSVASGALLTALHRSTLYHARFSDARQGATVLSSAAGQDSRLTRNHSLMPRWYRPLS